MGGIINSDMVVVKCECGEDLHFICCAGPRNGSVYSLTNIPPACAAELNGDYIVCGCGRKTTLTAQVFVQTKVEEPK